MTLPIMAYRSHIIDVVQDNAVTIIKAETGAGKSTKVPQFLLQCADKVVVTQPRRLAAINLAERVAEEMGIELGGLVGYKTALEYKRSDLTNLMFCTDGLEIVSQILGVRTPQGILIIDEVHEWNPNIELLVAWSRFKLEQKAPYKVVLMSATIEPEPLVAYFGKAATVTVPGRTFPIEEREPKGTIEDEAVTFLREGRSMLIFLPGKKQIFETVESLERIGLSARILPLHAELPLKEQQKCFEVYEEPKCIVATNVAQTSLTIPGIDAVIDSGLEWRRESIDNVEGMYLRPLTLDGRDQRKGRAGRTKPGVYVDFCEVPEARRLSVLEPAITRLPMEKVLLLLAHIGIDIEAVPFFHQPALAHIERARQVLYDLGCVDEAGEITPTGRLTVSIPVALRWARVLVEAKKRGVLEEAVLLASIGTATVSLVLGSARTKFSLDPRIEPLSDAFRDFYAFELADALPNDELERFGIHERAYKRVAVVKKQLHEYFWRNKEKPPPSSGNIQNLIASLYTGFPDCLYKKSVLGGYYDKHGKQRDLPKDSVVKDAPLLIGVPYDSQIGTAFGPEKRRMLLMATRVDLELFAKVVPHLVKTENGKTTVNGIAMS